MRKKLLITALIAVFVFMLAPHGLAYADLKTEVIKLKIGSKTVYVNGNPKQMDVAPFIDIHSNRTLVPVRFVAEGLGGKVSWHPKERFVGVRVGVKKVGLWIGNKNAEISKQTATWDRFDTFKTVQTDQAPEIVPPGRTMIPLRFVSESVGAKVDWNGKTREITITLSYVPQDIGDILFSIPFDREATETTGWAISPRSAFAVDPDHNSLFVYGEKRRDINNPEEDYVNTTYLFKYDSLTGIRIDTKEIFKGVIPDDGYNGRIVQNWIAYNNGYLYCASPNYGIDVDTRLEKSAIIIKKLDPVHMSVIWAKEYNLVNTFVPGIKPYKRNDWVTWDYARVPLKFTQNGDKFVLIMSITFFGFYKGYSSSYDYLIACGINTNSGNIAWKNVQDLWAYFDMTESGLPVYQGRYMYLFEKLIDPLGMYNIDKPDEYPKDAVDIPYNYQTAHYKEFVDKLVKETKANANLKPPVNQCYAPERLVCLDMETGKIVWSHYFIDNMYEEFDKSSPRITIVNGVLYIIEDTYDNNVPFNYGNDYGVELLRFNALTGEQLPLYHKPQGLSPQSSYQTIVLSINNKPQALEFMRSSYLVHNGYIYSNCF